MKLTVLFALALLPSVTFAELPGQASDTDLSIWRENSLAASLMSRRIEAIDPHESNVLLINPSDMTSIKQSVLPISEMIVAQTDCGVDDKGKILRSVFAIADEHGNSAEMVFIIANGSADVFREMLGEERIPGFCAVRIAEAG